MSYVDKTFTFDSDIEDWTGYPITGDVTMTRETGDGSPGAGCLSASVYGKNKNPGTSYWEWAGTFVDLGVPAGATVTAIGTDPNNDYNWRCSEYDTGTDPNNFAAFEIYDDTPTLIGSIIPAQANVTTTTSWAGSSGGAELALSNLPSSTTIRLRLSVVLRTGNSGTAVVTLLADQIALRITYSTGINNRLMMVVSNQ